MTRFCLLIICVSCAIAREGIIPDSLPVWNGKSDSTTNQTQEPPAQTQENLETKGSKTISISAGENGADIQQELKLSIKGEATEGVFIDAYLADVGREPGTEITTTLREADAVHIMLEHKNWQMQLGDVNAQIDRLNLWGLNRATLGAGLTLRTDNNSEVKSIYGNDKTERHSVTFAGNAGQQKGYTLFQETNSFGVIVPNTERVYLNGRLLQKDKDYNINEAGGVLDFAGKIIPNSQDEIRVEFDSYTTGFLKTLRTAETAYRSKFLWLDIAAFELRDSLQSERRLGNRLRLNIYDIYTDAEIAMNEKEHKAFRWQLTNDSSAAQKKALKLTLQGNRSDSAFVNTQGTNETQFSPHILNNEWHLNNDSLRERFSYDEASAVLKLSEVWFPGVYAGHRNYEAFKLRSFLERKTTNTESGIYAAKLYTDTDEIIELNLQSAYIQGDFRPYGNIFYDNRETITAKSGAEMGNQAHDKYANSEIIYEQKDSIRFSEWKTYVLLTKRDLQSKTLLLIHNEIKNSYLFEQLFAYSNPKSFITGNLSYNFNYTNEIPWLPIYRKVPDGTGDVLYDSLTGQYITGVDNGNFVYEGMGRPDSLKAKLTYKNDLQWSVQLNPGVLAETFLNERGILNDITLNAEGKWLLHSIEKLLYLENSVLWMHPQRKGSLRLAAGNRREEYTDIISKEQQEWQEMNTNYMGRKHETWSLTLKKENSTYEHNNLNWDSYFGLFSVARELGKQKDFSIEPFYSQKYTKGLYYIDTWNVMLKQGGVNGKWQSERGNSVNLGASVNLTNTIGNSIPYSANDGFADGISLRAQSGAQISLGENFILSLQYVIRKSKDSFFQKLSSEARAYF